MSPHPSMSEREDLTQQIDELRARRASLAELALSADATGDFRTSDSYLEWQDRTSDEICRMHAQLWEIEAYVGLKEFVADVAYGRSL